MTARQHFLVTGAYGCIGSWVVRLLLDEGCGVTTYDLGGSDHRLRLLLDDAELAGLDRVAGDVTDLEQVRGTMRGPRRDARDPPGGAAGAVRARADPPLGARVNVVGTVTVFEAVRACSLAGTLAYASSIAAYDPPEPGREHEQRGVPSTLYGVFKRANEETAGVYWADHGIASVGLRPHTVYGLGRDQGVTSAPTKAHAGGRGGHQLPHPLRRPRRAAARPRRGAAVHRRRARGGRGRRWCSIRRASRRRSPRSSTRSWRPPRTPAGAVGFDDVVGVGIPEQGDTSSFVALLGELPTIPAARRRGRDDRELPRTCSRAASSSPSPRAGVVTVGGRPPSESGDHEHGLCAADFGLTAAGRPGSA